MNCPHCDKELRYPNRAWHNAVNYKKTVRVTTECCYKIISLTPVSSVKIEKAVGQFTDRDGNMMDDWCVPEGELGKEEYELMDAEISKSQLGKAAPSRQEN